MKKLSFLFGVILLLPVLGIAQPRDLVPGQIMIDIKHQYLPITTSLNGEDVIVTGLPSIDSLNHLFGVFSFEKLTDDSWSATKGFYLLKFPDSLDVNLVHSFYSADTHIHLAGLCGFRHPAVTPSDYYFSEQWGLKKMKCPEAWRHTNGSRSIIIQIIDGGTDYGHPDLMRNIWQNLGEDADHDGHTIEWDPSQNKWVLDREDTTDRVDGDSNGYLNDLVGWDFYWRYRGTDPKPDLGWPWGDHGDKTAGTAAAVTNNRIGVGEATWICNNDTNSVAGTSWFSKIMIARCGGTYDDDFDARAIRAIHYGRNKGARIISMSWDSDVDNTTLHAVLDSAYNEGILLIASAGNDHRETPVYPAAYLNVIAVAGTESTDVKAYYSNYGTWVDICAPYRSVAPSRSLSNWNYYCYDDSFAGTSASAPFVAGVAALVWSCNYWATNAQVKNAILTTADNIYSIPGNAPYYGKLGSGRVNAWNAVKVFRPIPPPPGECNRDGEVNTGDLVYLISYVYKNGPPPDPWCVGNVNGDDVIDISDVIYFIDYNYKGGPHLQNGCE